MIKMCAIWQNLHEFRSNLISCTNEYQAKSSLLQAQSDGYCAIITFYCFDYFYHLYLYKDTCLKTALSIPLTQKAACRILQITDTHLFANDADQLLGVNTQASYTAVLTAIKAANQHYDLILATGDLVQDHSQAGYQRFVDGVARLATPCAWLQGNHDETKLMTSVLEQSALLPNKTVLLGEDWLIILLNSQVAGVPYGHLSDAELARLDTLLAAHPQRHALIALHHHPAPSGCEWLDAHQLNNSTALNHILAKHDNVKVLLCGHIHQEIDRLYQSARLISTPSTCVQFKPQQKSFALDQKQPGWRELTLHADGRVDTTVHYLSGSEFVPDTQSKGY